MNHTYKPKDYNALSPYLIVPGADKMIDLLTEVFGAKELRKYEMPDGTIMHAELMIDDSVIMISDSSDKFPPNQTLIHVYVPDVDSTFKKAINAGCTIDKEPKVEEGDPDKRGSFIDFAGNTWAVGTQILTD